MFWSGPFSWARTLLRRYGKADLRLRIPNPRHRPLRSSYKPINKQGPCYLFTPACMQLGVALRFCCTTSVWGGRCIFHVHISLCFIARHFWSKTNEGYCRHVANILFLGVRIMSGDTGARQCLVKFTVFVETLLSSLLINIKRTKLAITNAKFLGAKSIAVAYNLFIRQHTYIFYSACI